MARRTWRCGCVEDQLAAGTPWRAQFCVEHEHLGQIATAVTATVGARELWEALEASPASSVRELAHTLYFRLEEAAGRALALLAIAQGPAEQ